MQERPAHFSSVLHRGTSVRHRTWRLCGNGRGSKITKRELQEHENHSHRDQGVRAGQRKAKPNIGHDVFDLPVQGRFSSTNAHSIRRERRESFRSKARGEEVPSGLVREGTRNQIKRDPEEGLYFVPEGHFHLTLGGPRRRAPNFTGDSSSVFEALLIADSRLFRSLAKS
jgi:hypothetical protein